jgi:hypothetical protein
LEVLAQSKIVFVVHSLFGTAAKPYALNAGQQIRQQSEAGDYLRFYLLAVNNSY